MVEVTKSNFEELMPDIEETIKNATFIAMDAEFTGLKMGTTDYFSLFDSMEERYQKLKIRATSFTLNQIGISVFTQHPCENGYMVKTFVFYIRPYLCGNIDKYFVCQASSIDFLCRYDFDFNKVFKEGIPFINEIELKQLHEDMKKENFVFGFNLIDREQDLLINETMIRPERQLTYAGSKLPVSPEATKRIVQLPKDKLYPAYFQILAIKQKYPTLTAYVEGDQVIVVKTSEQQDSTCTLQEEKEKALDSCLGFTRVFRLLKNSQKPIVGHNLLMDLLLCFHNFHEPLPDSYKNFKQEVHTILPTIFDTRQMWRNMKKYSNLRRVPSLCGLYDLYDMFKKPPSYLTTLYFPNVEFSNKNKYAEGEFRHDSGYDSYVTGWVFLNICHVLAMKKFKKAVYIEPQTFKQYLSVAEPFANKVNLSRSKYLFIDLAGDETEECVPEELFVLKKNKEPLNERDLIAILKRYGPVDVKLLADKSQAVVAVTNHNVFKGIIKDFEGHKDYEITEYKGFRFSSYLDKILWCTAAGSAVVVAVLIRKLL